MVVTKQFIAACCLFGMGFDALGGCYLAYDLFGGRLGPFRLIARAAGYMSLFFIGYGLVLGFAYAPVAAAGMGLLLAFEYGRRGASEEFHKRSRLKVASFGLWRGLVLGLASWTVSSLKFAILFGLISGAALATTYVVGFAPIDDFSTNTKPQLNRHKLIASALRMIGVGIAGVVAAYFTRGETHLTWTFGLRLGLAAGVVSALVGVISPWIEWQIDQLHDRKLGMVGLALIFVGMLLQSVQYWVVVLNIPVA